MFFEWDEKKNKANKTKHKISFEDALYVFTDPLALCRNDILETERRQQIIGQINGVLIILAVYTIRESEQEEIIRIISARKATVAERGLYEKGEWY